MSKTASKTAKPKRRQASAHPFAAAKPGAAPAVAMALTVLAFLAGLALLQLLGLNPADQRHRLAQIDADASLLAQRLEDRIQLMHAMAEQLATAPPLLETLEDDLPLARQSFASQIEASTPYLLRLRIHERGQARVALDEDPPLSYAGLDMIRRAETGNRPQPEALRVSGRALPVVNIARAVDDGDGGVAGTVFLTFDANILGEILRRVDVGVSGVTLEQAIGEQERVAFLELGRDDGGLPSVSLDLADSSWRLTYRTDTGSVGAMPLSLLTLLPGLLLILLGALLGIALGYARLAKALRDDIAALVDSGSALLDGRDGAGAGRFTLLPMAAAAEALRQAAATSQRQDPASSSATANTATPASQPAADAVPTAAGGPDSNDLDDFLDIAEPESEPATVGGASASASATDSRSGVAAEIFRAYDIRGVVGSTLDENTAFLIGRAIASEAAAAGDSKVLVAADGRLSSPALRARLSAGITASGLDVIDLGAVPTPMLYFATEVSETRSGVMVTGSHNPPEYNGFKVVIGGQALADDRITALYERILAEDFVDGSAAGRIEERDLIPDYIDRIASDVTLAEPLKVVADCGNGIAGTIVPSLLEALGCEVTPMYCEVDGNFPNHHPDPADPANLEDLITVVKAEGADIGLAFDGDGDRLGVVTERGEIIWPDRLLMLFARDIVGRNPGADVIFDVKCSRHLGALVAEYGGRPIMWRSGHSHIKAKMQETGALLGGEFSGHICFGERWYGFDDGLYSAARLLEILAAEAATTGEIFDEFPQPVATPELKIETGEKVKFQIIEALAAGSGFGEGTVNTIDGIRVDYPEGWGLIRASNTAPVLTLRFEADDAKALAEIQSRFRQALKQVDSRLDFNT